MGSRLSLNIHGHNVPDKGRLLGFLQATQPHAVLVMDNFALAQEIKLLLPETMLIYRAWPDDGIYRQLSPEDWVNRKVAELGGADIWAYTTNEPGFSDAALNWLVLIMELAQPRGLKLVVGNWAVGTPGTDSDWPRARRLLELLDQNRATMVLGLHEYACGIITSGFIGGNPQFIAPETWPQDVHNLSLFHCGRFNFLVRYCRSIGLNPPRIVITEHGFDDVSDIKPWAESLARPGNYLNIRGWKSLQAQWPQWFSSLGWSPERALFEQLAYADRVIYQNSPVEAQLIFSWGHSSPDWEQFDISQALELQQHLIQYAQQPERRPAPVGKRAPVGERSPDDRSAPAPPVPPPADDRRDGDSVDTLGRLMTDDDLNTIIAGFRAAAKTGQFNSTISSGFARFADVLERYRAKRGEG
ncbi:MAG: hypothetical protein HZC41_05215 [Chloroflexi bacterium]|nr:hypothetical protein [Chloroflexota bacterium]